ncbi:CLUMA_CG001679, isoform A [Clunio marinus]|uniref:CLUMA_CG001679, isoform A n=1 Tax=Clunio marinus TaxID=568069 RepID=A0A1J1HKF3_9DIPT|nr:CLUMA_CG001679, isoform A [Clunio marinus]
MSLDNIHEELRIAEEQLRQRQQAQQGEMEQMELRRAQYINQIINANKVPDNIKLLPEFDGDSKKLKEWIDQVDDMTSLRVFEPFIRNLFGETGFEKSGIKLSAKQVTRLIRITRRTTGMIFVKH